MASKVNTQFVMILAAVLIMLAGAVGLIGFILVRSSASDHIRRAEAAAAEGNWNRARESYAKAVNKEQTNVEYLNKWIDAIQKSTPETEAAYIQTYQTELFAALSAQARQQRSNVEAQARFLDALFDRVERTGVSRGLATQIADEATQALSWMETQAAPPEGWQRLRRYRGLAIEALQATGATLEPAEREQVLGDLTAAIAADPDDAKSVAGLSRWHLSAAQAARQAGRKDEALAALDAAIAACTDVAAGAAGGSEVLAQKIVAEYERQSVQQTFGLAPAEARAAQQQLASGLGPKVDALADSMLAEPAGPMGSGLIAVRMLRSIEQTATQSNEFLRTREVLDKVVRERPDDALALLLSAEIDELRGQPAAARATLEKVAALPDVPVSLDGLVRFTARREASYRVAMSWAIAALGDRGEASVLESARAARQGYAQRAPQDDPRLLMLDGMLAQVENKLPEALRLYQRYNEQTAGADIDGLWRQGQVAAQQQQWGLAESSFRQVAQMQPGNTTVRLALAEVFTGLQRNAEALTIYEEVLRLQPENTQVAERVQALRVMANPDLSDDPVVAARLKARQARQGTADQLGDRDAAIAILAEAAGQLGHEPRVVIDLVTLYMEVPNLEAAREAVTKSIAAHPANATMQRLNTAFTGTDDPTDALLAVIESGDAAPVEKGLQKFRLLASRGKIAEADAVLEQAAAAAPNDARVVELQFLRALDKKEYDRAEAMLPKATELNLDQAGGLAFRSRLQAARGDLDGAIATLRGAIQGGSASPGMYRLLASQQSGRGLTTEAISSLESALALKPDDVSAINEYIGLLATSGRTRDAMEAARKMEVYARTDPRFNEMFMALLAAEGGEAGRASVMGRREAILKSDPGNALNRAALAELYVEAGRFGEARPIIEALRAERDSVALALLDARWHAEQPEVEVDGQKMDGLQASRVVFNNYLITMGDAPEAGEAYLAYARFMLNRGRLDYAVPAIRQAQERQDPKTRLADKVMADLLMTRQQYSDAMPLYKQVVDAGADDADQQYLSRLIETLVRTGKTAEAEQLLGTMKPANAEGVTPMLQRADLMLAKGDTARALGLYDAAVARHPGVPLVYTKRAQAKMGREDLRSDVLADLDAALRLQPGDWRTLRLRAAVLDSMGRRDEAINDLTLAVENNPDQDELVFGLARQLLVLNRTTQAQTLADRVLEQRAYDVGAMVDFARVFASTGQWNDAAKYLKMAWDRQRILPVGVLLVDAMVRSSPPQVQPAQEVFNQLRSQVSDADTDPVLLVTEAAIFRVMDRENSARRRVAAAYDASLAKGPGLVLQWAANVSRAYADNHGAMADMFAELLTGQQPGTEGAGWIELMQARALMNIPGRRGEAEAIFARLQQGSDDSPLVRSAYRFAGSELYRIEDAEAAAKVWQATLSRFPDDWETANNLAFILANDLKRPQDALPLAEKAVAAAPQGTSEVYDTLATVYIGLNRPAEAAEAIETAQRSVGTVRAQCHLLITRAKLAVLSGQKAAAKAFLVEARSMTGGTDNPEGLLKEIVEAEKAADALAG